MVLKSFLFATLGNLCIVYQRQQTHIYTQTSAHTHTHICTHIHRHTCTNTHTHTHIHTHTHTHTHTHIHTHTQKPFRDIKVEDWFEEVYSLRFMRFAFRVRPFRNEKVAENVLHVRAVSGLRASSLQFLATRMELVEPQVSRGDEVYRPYGHTGWMAY
jgi:hypothetical protein